MNKVLQINKQEFIDELRKELDNKLRNFEIDKKETKKIIDIVLEKLKNQQAEDDIKIILLELAKDISLIRAILKKLRLKHEKLFINILEEFIDQIVQEYESEEATEILKELEISENKISLNNLKEKYPKLTAEIEEIMNA